MIVQISFERQAGYCHDNQTQKDCRIFARMTHKFGKIMNMLLKCLKFGKQWPSLAYLNFTYVSLNMIQWAVKLELEKEEASSFKANVFETSGALQILYLMAEEREHQHRETKVPESINTERLIETVECLNLFLILRRLSLSRWNSVK